MSEQEKETAAKLADIINRLPPEDLRFLQGYAEGVASAAKRRQEEPEGGDPDEEG